MKPDLYTTLQIEEFSCKIGLKNPILTLGSCFSDEIGRKLNEHKFEVLANPFGTLYNPISLTKLLENTIKLAPPDTNRYVQFSDDLFLHFDHHSDLRSNSINSLSEKLERTIESTHKFIKKTKFLIITLGTAHVYKLKSDQKVVNNCHKQHWDLFTKEIIKPEEILKRFQSLFEHLDHLTIILTVSPVRHTKDSLQGNSLSKSILRFCCAELESSFDHVHYFPSYEIMIDELRDYRFYKDDLIHPSPFAISYIWQKFQQTYFDAETKTFVDEWSKILQALNHRPFEPASQAHQTFLTKTINRLEELSRLVSVEKEIQLLNNQLVK